jgi:GTP pyrophosphokinase
LDNGDQVHVTTSKNQKPSEDWLKMVVTGRAKSKIKSALREDIRKLADMGKEMLERKLSHLKLDLEINADNIAKHYGFKNRTDLFASIYNGYINLSDLKEYKIEHGRILFDVPKVKKVEVIKEPAPQIKKNRKPKSTSRQLVSINGEPGEQYDYSFATCCNPVMGDDIFAFVGTNSGVKIHRTACPNAENMMTNFGYRTLNAEWSSQTATEFIANLVITGIDDGPGVIERVTGEISSKLGMNIRSFSMAGDEGYYEGKMSLIVTNTNQLNQAIRALKSLQGVSTVTRTD